MDTIIKRYKETRRMHPLQDQCGSLEAAVNREIALMVYRPLPAEQNSANFRIMPAGMLSTI